MRTITFNVKKRYFFRSSAIVNMISNILNIEIDHLHGLIKCKYQIKVSCTKYQQTRRTLNAFYQIYNIM